MKRLGHWPELVGLTVSIGLLLVALFWTRIAAWAAIPSWLVLCATAAYRIWGIVHNSRPADVADGQAPMRLHAQIDLEYPAGGDVQDAIRQALLNYLRGRFPGS